MALPSQWAEPRDFQLTRPQPPHFRALGASTQQQSGLRVGWLVWTLREFLQYTLHPEGVSPKKRNFQLLLQGLSGHYIPSHWVLPIPFPHHPSPLASLTGPNLEVPSLSRPLMPPSPSLLIDSLPQWTHSFPPLPPLHSPSPGFHSEFISPSRHAQVRIEQVPWQAPWHLCLWRCWQKSTWCPTPSPTRPFSWEVPYSWAHSPQTPD